VTQTRIPGFTIRIATPADVPTVLGFIRDLAVYEKLLHEVTADEATLGAALFGARQSAEALIGELDGEPVAFAVFFHNFSTFVGKPGLYLEDLFVQPEQRGKGLGKVMLEHLAAIAKQRGCARFEWWVLDWNTSAIEFYQALGAVAMDEWTVFRVTGAALDKLATGGGSAPAHGGDGVRRATPADLDALAPLFDAYRGFYGRPSDVQACRAFLGERLTRHESVIYGAWAGGRLVGFMQLYPTFSSLELKPAWNLNDLFVSEAARGRGTATRLLEAAHALARVTGAAYLTLQTGRGNTSAQGLYARQGWTQDDDFLHYHKAP
jgi:GNAT superfamily N-acetyltransferase